MPEQHVMPQRPISEPAGTRSRRPIWRQRLVDAERGISHSLRSDSTLFVYFFVSCIIVTAGGVLGISLTEWTIVVLALSVVASAEIFNLVLRAIWRNIGHQLDSDTGKTIRMATAGVYVTILGACVAISLIFGQRLAAIWGS